MRRLLLWVPVWLLLCPAAFAFSVVQKAIGPDSATSVTSVALSFPAAAATGDTIMGMVSYFHGSLLNPTITDNAGNIYTIEQSSSDAGDSAAIAVFQAVAVSGTPQTITASWGATSVGGARIEMIEVSGIGSYDTSTGQQVYEPSPAASGTITPSGAGEFLYGVVRDQTHGTAVTAWTAGSGFTLQNQSLNTDVQMPMADETETDSGSGAVQATFTYTGGNGYFWTGIMAFRAGAAPPSCPKTLSTLGAGC